MHTAKHIAQRAGRVFVMAAMALGAHAAQAYTVSLGPASQTFVQGDVVTATVTASASDLSLIGLGAYNFDFTFDGSILSFVSAASALALGAGSDFLYAPSTDALSLLEVSQIDAASLLALQADELSRSTELTLFTLTFNAIAPGTTTLAFSDGAMSDVNGGNQQFFGEFSSSDTRITVLENLTVPVPGTLPLVLAAAMAGVLVRRRA
jgi:hypothetical protein